AIETLGVVDVTVPGRQGTPASRARELELLRGAQGARSNLAGDVGGHVVAAGAVHEQELPCVGLQELIIARYHPATRYDGREAQLGASVAHSVEGRRVVARAAERSGDDRKATRAVARAVRRGLAAAGMRAREGQADLVARAIGVVLARRARAALLVELDAAAVHELAERFAAAGRGRSQRAVREVVLGGLGLGVRFRFARAAAPVHAAIARAERGAARVVRALGVARALCLGAG